MSRTDTLFCEAAKGVSDAMMPTVSVLFGDLPPVCGRLPG